MWRRLFVGHGPAPSPRLLTPSIHQLKLNFSTNNCEKVSDDRKRALGHDSRRASNSNRRSTKPGEADANWTRLLSRLSSSKSSNFSASQLNEILEALKYLSSQRWSDSALQQAFLILDRLAEYSLLHRHDVVGTRRTILSTELVNSFVNNWRKLYKNQSKQPSSTNLLVPSEVWEKIQSYGTTRIFSPDSKTYAMIFDASSISKDPEEGAWFCESKMNQILDQYESGVAPIQQPDVFVFSSVIHSWAKSGLHEAPKKAEEWLNRIISLKEEHGWETLELNAYIYNEVILAWARQGNGLRAEKLLQNMIRDKRLLPDAHCVNSVLLAWAKSKDFDAAERAENILNKMHQWYDSGELLESPNCVSYTIVLEAWSRSRQQNALERSALLFAKMKYLYSSGHPELKPNTRTYNQVIAAYARAGRPQDAESFLGEMLQQFGEGDDDSRPNIRTFSSILSAWSRVPTKGLYAAKRAEAILRKMILLFDTGKIDVNPNAFTYSCVISTWAKTAPASTEAAKRAESLLQEMKERGIAADLQVYSSVINSYARVGNLHRADQLLECLLQEYFAELNPKLKPTCQTFTALLAAAPKHGSDREIDRSEGILNRMKHLAAEFNLDTEPNAFSYTAVLEMIANSKGRDALTRGEAVFKEMTSSKRDDTRPNFRSYGAMIRLNIQAGLPDEADLLLADMLHEYRSQGRQACKPNLGFFHSLLRCWSLSSSPQAPEKSEKLLMLIHEMVQAGEIEFGPDRRCYQYVRDCWATSNLAGAKDRAAAIGKMLETSRK